MLQALQVSAPPGLLLLLLSPLLLLCLLLLPPEPQRLQDSHGLVPPVRSGSRGGSSAAPTGLALTKRWRGLIKVLPLAACWPGVGQLSYAACLAGERRLQGQADQGGPAWPRPPGTLALPLAAPLALPLAAAQVHIPHQLLQLMQLLKSTHRLVDHDSQSACNGVTDVRLAVPSRLLLLLLRSGRLLCRRSHLRCAICCGGDVGCSRCAGRGPARLRVLLHPMVARRAGRRGG